MRIAHFGTFDVENYGDLLFPLIVRRRLEGIASEVVHVSPVGGPPVWGDCVPTVRPEALDPAEIDAVVLGGGNIVHAGPAGVDDYRNDGLTWLLAYARLWIEPARIAAARGVPLCWNSPGVPQPFSPRVAELARWAAERADHLTVRDRTSERNLRGAGVERPITIVPDPTFDVARLFTPEELNEAYAAAFARRDRPLPGRALAVHLERRYLDEPVADVVARLERMAERSGSALVLLALGPCHGDAELAREAAAALGPPHLVVDRPASVRELVALLARSDAYVGSSLHGMITALAFGRPGLVVAAESHGRFADMLQQFRLADRLVPDWATAEERAGWLAGSAPGVEHAARAARTSLDEHWAGLAEALARPGRSGPDEPAIELSVVIEEGLRAVAAAARAERLRTHELTDELRWREEQAKSAAEEIATLRQRLETAGAEAERGRRDLEGERRMRAEIERVLATERNARTEAEAILATERDGRTAAEELLDRERDGRAEAEAALAAGRAEAEAALAAEREALAGVEAALAEERRARTAAEAARAEAEHREGAARSARDSTAEELVQTRRDLTDRTLAIERARGELAGVTELATRVSVSQAWRLGHFLARMLRWVTFRRPKGTGAMPKLLARSQAAQEALSLAAVATPPGAATAAPAAAAPSPPKRRTWTAAERLEAVGSTPGLHAPPRDAAGVLRGGPASGGDSVDVVICVHDALDDVHRCVTSLLERTSMPFRLIVVDDGSAEETARYLDAFAALNPAVDLRRNAEPPHGYTIAANIGVRASTAEYVVLLNSDTVVTRGWLERLLAPAHADEHVGIVGPLSNAATHQSVPQAKNGSEWAINDLPEWLTEDALALLIGELPGEQSAEVPFLNGFCYCVRRRTIDAIGLFDEEHFGDGYSEENDYSRRAAEAGLTLAVAGRSYVFHAKSRSYGHEGRRELAKRNYQTFLARHGEDHVRSLVADMEANPTLAAIRARVAESLASPATAAARLPRLGVTFVVPGLSRGGSGGSHSIYQEVRAMASVGLPARMAVASASWEHALGAYPDAAELAVPFDAEDDLAELTAGDHVLVATHYKSVPLVARLVTESPALLGAYYVQDYEPLFAAAGSAEAVEAEQSYTAIPDAVLFAKTHWLRTTLTERLGVPVAKVEPSLDRDLFHTEGREPGDGPVRVLAMVRPRTPRRAPAETLTILARLVEAYGDRVRVTTFGCDADAVEGLGGIPDGIEHAGLVSREEVARLLRGADVFLDCSWYQAFGRTGLEAMACGATAVLPRIGGVREFARDGENCLLSDTWEVDDTYAALARLVEDEPLLRRLQAGAVEAARPYSTLRAAFSEYALFCHEYARRTRLTDAAIEAPSP